MENKNQKRALSFSMLSIVLCVAMLIGTTFAWFTDNASTGVNLIQAGTLDVELQKSEDNGKTWTTVEENESLAFQKAAEGEEISFGSRVLHTICRCSAL
ncbi:CalY family protein [Blautia sp. RD014234]|nr:CalY family protein [Blautia parvula]